MSQKEYLREMVGQEPAFGQLVDDVYPQMEVRVFLKNGIREFKEGTEEGKQKAATRLKMILCAWEYDRAHNVAWVDTNDAHESGSILQTLRTCFFSQGWSMELYDLLARENRVDEWTRETTKELAQDILNFGERDGNNRAFFYALGHIYAANNFPEVPKSAEWRTYAEAVFADWYETGDCYEPGYVAHNISWVIKLGKLLGKEKELKSERVHKIFTRYLDHISPSGLAIAPGDGDDQSSYLAALKEMYEVTEDKAFLWAYEQATAAGEYGGYRGKTYERVQSEKEVAHEGVCPETGCTQIQYMYPDTAKVADRMILNPSREAGNPYMAMVINDRYDTLHHESEDNRGDIYHYEADGVLYLKRSSWYKWAEQTNTVMVKDAIEEFPFVYSEGLVKNHWYHARTNLRLMEHFMPDEEYEMCLKSFETYKHFAKAKPIETDYDMPLPLQYTKKSSPYGLFLSNPKGIAGKNQELDLDSITLSLHTFKKEYWTEGKKTFDASMTWNRDEHRNLVYSDKEVDVEITNLYLAGQKGKYVLHENYDLLSMLQVIFYPEDGSEHVLLTEEEKKDIIRVEYKDGAPVFYIHCKFGRLDLMFKGLKKKLNMTTEYSWVGFDYRYTSDVSTYLRTPIKVLINRITTRSSHIDHQQGGILKDNRTEQRAKDSYGEVLYEGAYTYDTNWKRKSLLTEEGYLIVVDEICPGEDAEGMAGGPIWQLWNPPMMGIQWADAVVEENQGKNLLVYCHPQRGHRYGLQAQPKLWVDRHYAFYDRAVLQAGKKEVFVSVLIPHDSSVSPITICNKKNEGGCLEPTIAKKDYGVITLDETTSGIVTNVDEEKNVEVLLNTQTDIQNMKIFMGEDGSWKIERF